MGLGVNIGLLAYYISLKDEDAVSWFRKDMAAINRLLELNNLPTHKEPEQVPTLANRASVSSFPYSFIHHLRRSYAHRSTNSKWPPEPLEDGNASIDPWDDPVLMAASRTCTSHLICHSDAEGYYLPIKFSRVLIDDTQQVSGGKVGSSYLLLEELIDVAPEIDVQLKDDELPDVEAERINSLFDPHADFYIEQIVWLALFEAARLSIAHNTAICFS